MSSKLDYAQDVSGKRFALVGAPIGWPRFHPGGPTETLRSRGASVAEKLSADVDYIAVFGGRQKGRAAGKRKAEQLAAEGKVELLDQQGLLHMLRPDLSKKSFVFVGGFDCEVDGVPESHPRAMAEAAGATVLSKVHPDMSYAVVGRRRKKGKTAELRHLEMLAREGHLFRQLTEEAFLELVSSQGAPRESRGLADLVVRFQALTDSGRLKRALKMLKAESFQLFLDVTDEHLVGIVRSQTGASKFYSTRVHASGEYWCCGHDLADCMGMQGRMCKHLIVLALGAVQTGEISAATVEGWLASAASRGPKKEEQAASDTILRYRSAEAGELDWRPAETTPEDFYAF